MRATTVEAVLGVGVGVGGGPVGVGASVVDEVRTEEPADESSSSTVR